MQMPSRCFERSLIQETINVDVCVILLPHCALKPLRNRLWIVLKPFERRIRFNFFCCVPAQIMPIFVR